MQTPQNKLILSCIVVALVCSAAGFFGGMQYNKSSRPNNMRFTGAGGAGLAGGMPGQRVGAGGQGQVRMFGGGSAGEVVSKDDKSLTLKLMDGGSKIVFFSASTTVNKMTEGSLADVAQGTNVMVIGTPNQDGSLTATQVQIRPNLPDRMPKP